MASAAGTCVFSDLVMKNAIFRAVQPVLGQMFTCHVLRLFRHIVR